MVLIAYWSYTPVHNGDRYINMHNTFTSNWEHYQDILMMYRQKYMDSYMFYKLADISTGHLHAFRFFQCTTVKAQHGIVERPESCRLPNSLIL